MTDAPDLKTPESHLACLIQEREEKKMNSKISKWLTLAASLMFVGATFQITGENYIPGVICFAAAASFAYSAKVYRERAKTEKQEGADNNEDPGLERKSENR